MRDHERDFFVRGNHGTISACTLPPWTPSAIVERMNDSFGEILRQDLVTLMDQSKDTRRSFRNRCNSTGSEMLSIDSSEGSGGGFLHQIFPRKTL